VSRATPRSGTQAAGELVRVEFDRARHTRDLARLRIEARKAIDALDSLDERARALCAVVTGDRT
jgi:hypothetical protein